ncbi:MAG: hypothetical protein JWR37_2696 [Mycobacterium sp.]|nr:hypothetical protein [Mycobacterium sp.]
MMQWDEEVDVVCVGSGAGGLATAIVAVDAGLTVFVADSMGGEVAGTAAPRPDSLQRRLGASVVDRETDEYLDALAEGLAPLTDIALEAAVPVRVVDEPPPVELGRHGRPKRATVETFYGARLKDWADQCAASPYGVLYSEVSDRSMSPMRSRSGEAIEAAVIGCFEPDAEVAGPTLADWLSAEAEERDIEVHQASPLQRIVFDEEANVMGAVVSTFDGRYAVRARHGVTLGIGDHRVDSTSSQLLPAGTSTFQVCVVSRPASRFGRVELLVKEPLAPKPLCVTSLHRQSRARNHHNHAMH